MYSVSNAYKNKIKSNVIRSRVIGTINGIPFTDENILEGSFSITNQCSGNDQVQIGQVYIAELNITLIGLTFDRYTLDGMEIIPIYQLATANGYEDVPLGHFFVGEANHTAAGVVIKAYDAMSKLDKNCLISTTIGTPYQLATMACNACFLTLATTSAEFSSFANASQNMAMYQNGTDITSWRDFISWVAQACGCYVTCNRDGDIVFRAYNQTVVETITNTQRFQGASFSDYITRYTGIYVTNAADSTMTYYGLTPDDGLTYSLGENPFLQYGTEEQKTVMRRAVLTSLSRINYVPFKLELVDDPRYDLGDVLNIPGGFSDASALFCVTKYVWSYHKAMTLEGVGQNPALATAQSKVEKEIAGLVSKKNEDTTCFYRFKNAEEFWIRDGQTAEILRIDFITSKEAHVDFRAELKFESDTTETSDTYTYHVGDTIVTLTYYLNDEEVAYQPLGTYVDDIFLEHLMYWWFASADVIGKFVIELTANGGDVKIGVGDLNALLYGEGLVGEKEDLNPVLKDRLPALTFDLFDTFTDAVDTDFQTPTNRAASDAVSQLTFSGAYNTFTDDGNVYAGIGCSPTLTATLQFIEEKTVPTDGNWWKATDNNQYIQTVNIYGATGFLALTGGMLSYQLSVDDGVTWGSWNGSSIVAGEEMTYTTIHEITTWPPKVMVKIIFDNAETLGGFIVEGGTVTQ